MNDHNLETLLSGLQPRGPSAALTREVAHELDLDRQWMRAPVRQRPKWFTPVLWSAAGAAAALVIMSGLAAPDATPAPAAMASVLSPAAPASILPVRTIREVVSAEDEGIRYNADSRLPEQHVRLVSVERHAWIDPRDGAQITVEEAPREDSVILPVSFQ